MDQKTDNNRTPLSKPEPAGGAAASGAALPREAPEKEYGIDIYRDWCKDCGICAAFCPRGCIKMNAAGQPEVVAAGRCTGCRWCELHCPDFAICVKELAAQKKAEEAD